MCEGPGEGKNWGYSVGGLGRPVIGRGLTEARRSARWTSGERALPTGKQPVQRL